MRLTLLAKLIRSDRFVKRIICHCVLVLCLSFNCTLVQSAAYAEDSVEYQVKAAFIANFIAFTNWPDDTLQTIDLCIYGEDYFGSSIDQLQNKSSNNRKIRVRRISDLGALNECQVVFISKSNASSVMAILDSLRGKPMLTLADSPNMAAQGVVINMNLRNEKIVFEVNLKAARESGLYISSQLLQLATRVYQ
ncbi:YfiR family protein [Nitrosomonas sp.]|uniref:YfiR family protein n=1 Tax=Nitrosomonas sp. TaxID=42353 RepID=UPI002628271D|nr:YfiR family protein [Nitrosomonas sp.]